MTSSKIICCPHPYDPPHVAKVPFYQHVIERFRQHGQRVAIIDAETKVEWTFSRIKDAVERLSAALQVRYGLIKGQVVALALPNCPEFIVSLLAITRCGCIVSLVNPAYTKRELDNAETTSSPVMWICSPEVKAMLDGRERLQASDQPVRFILVGSSSSDSHDGADWESVVDSGNPAEFVEPSFDVVEDVALLPFSSGTTGMPKGVMLTHYNVLSFIYQFKYWSALGDETQTSLMFLPMFHVFGCLVSLASLSRGCRMISMPKFSFTGMLQAVQDYKVTGLPMAPPVAVLLSKHPVVDEYDLSSITTILLGAASVAVPVLQTLRDKFGWNIMQGLGMTETTLTFVRTPSDLAVTKLGSIGTVLPFTEVKIISIDSGEELGPDETGEICVRGQTVMKGYMGNPAATAHSIDSDGWYHTGDLGYYDQEKWFYIVGRLKELIKYKGFSVAPAELESIILEHPEVTDAAVIGVPDDLAGELPKAYVVKRPDSSVTEQEIADYLNGQVSHHHQLHGGVSFISAIPKMASGKILRRHLVAMAQGKTPSD